jgi:hypothetical protein
MAKAFRFPRPADYGAGQPAVLCPADRVLALYNGLSGDGAERIAKKVRRWFLDEARRAGWAGVHFLKEVQTNYGGGCVLWRPPDQINVQVTVNEKVLVLRDETDSDGGED